MPAVNSAHPVLRVIALWAALLPSALPAATVDFAREVLPILQRSCFECHDARLQKGKLRLDSRVEASKKPGTIVPGKSAQSELVRRISLPKGHDDVMPSRGEPLSKSQTDLIKTWIDQGASWPETGPVAKHWAYLKPVRSSVPVFSNQSSVISPKPPATVISPQPASLNTEHWLLNTLDRFILARLQTEGLKPSPDA
ncbi:MAG: c-type cytochrome domain-containing protein, partial [Limisphaerales bacterium]